MRKELTGNPKETGRAAEEAEYELQPPNAAALIQSMRSVGYTVPTAIADILDNSISARAERIWINFLWKGQDSRVTILDDGKGMTEARLSQAMRPGSASPLAERSPEDLGRFGLGLKTASFSQCRRLTVWSRQRGSEPYGRCWDLDLVSKANEWRLLKPAPPQHIPEFAQLKEAPSGTLVVWELLDQFVGPGSATDKSAQLRFLQTVDEVSQHLSMIFHRYLEGPVQGRRKAIQIYVNDRNGRTGIRPWNPFSVPHGPSSKETPEEKISLNTRQIKVRGYVLPHKDRLTDDQFRAGGGPRGWIAQQGYYLYRNDRIILAGDWLRLGRERIWTREEQYKLARLSVDIPNSMDQDWGLDIKKSTARPPAAIRERLTALAESVRDDAKSVFVHRGKYGPRPKGQKVDLIKPWESQSENGFTFYRINRRHPLIASVLQRVGPLAKELNSVLRVLEETVPVQQIWIDVAESQTDQATPYQFDTAALLEDLRTLRREFPKASASELRAVILGTAPFDRFPDLVERILKED